jgi:hypothetical protein
MISNPTCAASRRSAGADDAADPQSEAERLQVVLGTLAAAAAASSEHAPPSVPDFMRPHFTWLVMGDANDRGARAYTRPDLS